MSDEEAYKKGYEENQGRYLVAGTMYRRSKISLINTIISTSVIGITLIFLWGAVATTIDNATLLFETSFWAILMTSVFSEFFSTYSVQDRFPRIFKTLGKGIHTYTLIDEKTSHEIQMLRAKRDREKDFLKKTFTVVGIVCGTGFFIALPAFAMYTGEFFAPQRSDGLVGGLPSAWWVPIKIEDDKIIMARTCILLLQYYSTFTVINMIIGIISFDICVGHTLLYEFKVLALAIYNFEKRAKFCNDPEHKKMELGPRLRLSLKQATQHHKVLLEIVEDYAEIYYYIVLVVLITITGMMCLSTLSLYSDIPFGSKVLYFLFTLTELANAFVLCCYGQVLLDAHDIVKNAVYSCNWPEYSSLIKDQVLITMMRTQRPLSITMGGFAEVNLVTYTQVIKTAFSYFSILRALN